MNASWIATRTLLAVRPDGQELAITLRIGVPYEIAPEEWACPVAIEGLRERLHDVGCTGRKPESQLRELFPRPQDA